MGSTVLVELADFLNPDILPSLPADMPRATLADETVSNAQSVLSALFYSDTDPKKLLNVKEDTIADAVVNIINTVTAVLPRQYKAALSRYKPNPSDATRSKVDAALYEGDHAPTDDSPDWTHCRFYIEFKRGDTAYDPWDDRSSKAPENERQSRAGVRTQLIAYAKNVFLYQHRTALFSLFIIGNSFRAMRWDMSGVIVSKKVNYVNDPRSLLDLVLHLVQLDATSQGMDPTATLIEPGTMAFRIMNELAEPNAQDMEYMEPGTENYIPPPAHPPPMEPPAETPQKKRPRAKQATVTAPLQENANAKPERPDDDFATIKEVGGDSRVFRYVREQFHASLAAGWPRYKLRIKVKIRDEERDRVFLVAKQVFAAPSMFGRATRGYIAVDAETRLFVFLKDSWRPFYEGVQQEGVYLEMFAGDEDIIVPAIICHGDVQNQQVFTAQYEEILIKKQKMASEAERLRKESDVATSTLGAKQDVGRKRPHPDEAGDVSRDPPPPGGTDLSDNKGTLRHHIHYRIAVKDVCLPFEMFRSTEQLIRLIFNCIETHYYVYKKHKLLHRDISAGNVLILPHLVTDENGAEVVEWRGVLTDWELAKPFLEDRSEEKARQPERTGTWQFMSVEYVNSQWTHPIGVPDELESFFHVLIFYAVRFLPHTISNTANFVVAYFDTFMDDGSDRHLCSSAKHDLMVDGNLKKLSLELRKTNGEPGQSPLNKLVKKLLQHFKARYEVLDYERSIKQKASAQTAALSGINLDEMKRARPRIKPRQKKPAWRGEHDDGELISDDEVTITPPDGNTKKLAADLDEHDQVLRLFDDIRRPKNTHPDLWDAVWVVQDQLVGYEPRIILVKNIVTSRTTGARGTDDGANKRPRTAGSNFATSSSQLPETGSSLFVLGNSDQPRA